MVDILQPQTSIVKLNATLDGTEMRLQEIRFDTGNTIAQIKGILERKFGTMADQMSLELRDTTEKKVCAMSDDAATLGSYGPQYNYTIHVTDTSGAAPMAGEFDDVSKVEKYKISEADYSKRTDTFRNFK